MRQKIIFGIIIGAVVCGFIGSYIGLDLYGKIIFGEIVFNGTRGYEAVAEIGFMIGGLFGAVCGFLLTLLLDLYNRKWLKMSDSKQTSFNFFIGFGFSILVYFVSTFLLFWFSVFRRAAVLDIPFQFDSDVYFATIIIPVITAVPWLPFAIIIGLISWKKGSKTGIRYLYIFTTLITIGLLVLFWNLPYT